MFALYPFKSLQQEARIGERRHFLVSLLHTSNTSRMNFNFILAELSRVCGVSECEQVVWKTVSRVTEEFVSNKLTKFVLLIEHLII
jgi:hypothetical protein